MYIRKYHEYGKFSKQNVLIKFTLSNAFDGCIVRTKIVFEICFSFHSPKKMGKSWMRCRECGRVKWLPHLFKTIVVQGSHSHVDCIYVSGNLSEMFAMYVCQKKKKKIECNHMKYQIMMNWFEWFVRNLLVLSNDLFVIW